MHDNTFMNQTMYRKMPTSEQLPYALYTAEQVRHFDRLSIEQYGIAGEELMQRAGQAAFEAMQKRWPEAKNITVVTGSGNNAGDGFVVARLAVEAGLIVQILQLGDRNKFSEDAGRHASKFDAISDNYIDYEQLPQKTDVIVDAILGTGLNSPVKGRWQSVIETINQHQAPVFSLDIPSGLNADTGKVMGVAVKADMTISFIGLKQGMFTGDGRDYCGEILFHALDIPAKVYASEILNCRRINWKKLKTLVPARSRIAHKGRFGHVLVVGGYKGFSGAARLAAEAAARAGAGLVSVATHPAHSAFLNSGRPELMVHSVLGPTDLDDLLGRVSVVVFGPGAGQSQWGRDLFERVIGVNQPVVVDADGLNLLAEFSDTARLSKNSVLTPHPGEAARLLDCSIEEIEADRFHAVSKLQQYFGCSVILKGAGSLIRGSEGKPVALCSDGNPGMASGGMGDVLSGIVAAFLAQGLSPDDAACAGVALHAAAGDEAARQGEIGMLACDLFEPIRGLLNA